MLLLAACDRHKPADTAPPVRASAAREKPPAWRVENHSLVVAVRDEASDPELLAAIIKAKATSEDARVRWNAANAQERAHWAVKWAAPLAEPANGRQAEHVWVKPVNWSPFRIEGVLASEPVDELANGKSLGDLVSFPVDELSDWIHLTAEGAANDFSGPHEGGFTMKVLEERFGRPPARPDHD